VEMFCHSPESWTQMWEEQIFEKGQVKVNIVLKDMTIPTKVFEEGTVYYWLAWSVEWL